MRLLSGSFRPRASPGPCVALYALQPATRWMLKHTDAGVMNGSGALLAEG